MPTPGHIYILINAAMPEFLKIGKTTLPPEQRAAQLSTSTGVPTRFLVAYSVFVSDCDHVEELVHTEFRKYRSNAGREFFIVPLKLAIETLIQLEKEHPWVEPSGKDEQTVTSQNAVGEMDGSERLEDEADGFSLGEQVIQQPVIDPRLRRKSGVDYAQEYKKAVLAEFEGNVDAAKKRVEFGKVMTQAERSHSLCLVAHSFSDPLTKLAFYKLAAVGGNGVARRKAKEMEKDFEPREIVDAINHYRDLVSRFLV